MTYKIIDGKGIIPELVRVIESGAFRDCESLTSIEIPYGVNDSLLNNPFTEEILRTCPLMLLDNMCWMI